MAALTSSEAKSFYYLFGAKQDDQDFYEAAAVEDLLAHGDFAHARSVFELGCGTGRLAQTLLTQQCCGPERKCGVRIQRQGRSNRR
ncbi:MAG: hypothetical protein ACI8TX_001833 [Hyphomicrobiaceae bacterium]|jgi:hypothetical protein